MHQRLWEEKFASNKWTVPVDVEKHFVVSINYYPMHSMIN